MGCSQSKNDLAICFVIFNPSKSKRLIMNYFYTRNAMELQGYPTFTLELVLHEEPEIQTASNVFHVKGNSVMFHKERLCRILETKIPKQYKKLMFCDADLVFKNPNYYREISNLLENYEIVHPFTECVWMDLTYKEKLLTRKSSVLAPGNKWDYKYHPGFAWAFRRDWYNEVGFFDYAISGSGDTLSCAAWTKKEFPQKFQSLPQALRRKYNIYRKLVSDFEPRITYATGIVEHLWHGTRENRQYSERHNVLNNVNDILDLINENSEGVFEFRPQVYNQFNRFFVNYFANRKDDDLSVIMDKITSTKVETKIKTS
jgi:hypothetical protein